MDLWLEAGKDPLNGIYTLSNGRPIFRVSTSKRFFHSDVSTIEKAIIVNGGNGVAWEHMAEIEYHEIHSTKIKYLGKVHKDGDIFRATGLPGLTDWARSRLFTGPDGKVYSWKLAKKAPVLRLEEDHGVIIANYHVKKSSLPFGLSEPCDAHLEILPLGTHMVELVFISFVYIEKMRQDKQESYQGLKEAQKGGKIGGKLLAGEYGIEL